ncbi:putative ribonuclease H-like domain-containing protein [Tanacetum coccineum]|uniref:Ribonuclease H-like domain-containing protein n=1 Tax=Tanacetum coccineum TaxID=301880 RepID=A0ABQ5IEM9_9ASTR
MIPQTTAISNIKLLILKKEEYDIWAMEMEHYIYTLTMGWLEGNSEWKLKKRISSGKDGCYSITSTKDFMDDAKEIWEAIKTRFGGNANSKKMQKAVFKQQFKAFTISSSEGETEGLANFADESINSLFANNKEVWDLLLRPGKIEDDIEEMDINWQIALIAIRMKKFYKKSGRRVRVDGKAPVGFDKKKLDASIVTSLVPLLGKCDQEAQILAYSQAVKKLEAPFVTFKKATSLNEKINFQANELYEKMKKLKNYKRIGSIGTSSEHSVDLESEISRVPQEMYVSKPISTNEKGNKDQLEDFKEFNRGSVTFEGSKRYITGKGRIRDGNLDFDSVSFVKELGHFNLFSISQICDKQHKIENQLNHRVKIIRSNNGTEFKNRDMLEFYRNKGIKQEYSNARTPQQNRVAERKNRTLIEAARTILADSLLPTTFWGIAVSRLAIFNQANPHAGTSEVTNSAGTSQTLNANASEEKDEDAELIVVPSAVKNTAEKVETRKSEIFTEPQQEKEAFFNGHSDDNHKI